MQTEVKAVSSGCFVLFFNKWRKTIETIETSCLQTSSERVFPEKKKKKKRGEKGVRKGEGGGREKKKNPKEIQQKYPGCICKSGKKKIRREKGHKKMKEKIK